MELIKQLVYTPEEATETKIEKSAVDANIPIENDA